MAKVGQASGSVEAVLGDLAQRNFGRSLVDAQRLAGAELKLKSIEKRLKSGEKCGKVVDFRGFPHGFRCSRGRVTHVFHCAAKVNLSEPFEMMKRDNVDATAHLLEFCALVRPKAFHHISTMGVLTPDMLDRRGLVPEQAQLGDVRCMPLYGTGDQANGYPQSKWLAEMYVFEARRQGLESFVHRPGLIGGHATTGAVAEDVFFHFLSDVLRLRRLPDMEGRKFNLSPVDWVAKAIVRIALREGSELQLAS